MTQKIDTPDFTVAVARAGKCLVTLSHTHLRVWDAKTGTMEREVKLPRSSSLQACALALDEAGSLAVVGGSRKALIIDLGTGKVRHTLKHPFAVNALDVAGTVVATSDHAAEKVFLWDLETGARISRIGALAGVALSPRADRLLIAGYGSASLVDTASGSVLVTASVSADLIYPLFDGDQPAAIRSLLSGKTELGWLNAESLSFETKCVLNASIPISHDHEYIALFGPAPEKPRETPSTQIVIVDYSGEKRAEVSFDYILRSKSVAFCGEGSEFTIAMHAGAETHTVKLVA